MIERFVEEPTQPSELVRACALVDALFEVSSDGLAPGLLERATRQREAACVLDRLVLPAALFAFDTDQPQLQNQAWRKHVAVPPPRLLQGLAEVARTGTALHIPELLVDLDQRRRYYAAMLRPHRGCLGAPNGVTVVCIDATDPVIARKLGVTAEALVWGGRVSAAPEYWNEAWKQAIGPVAHWQTEVHAEDLTRCQQALLLAVRRRASEEIEARLRRASGEYRWYRVQFLVDAEDARWFGTAVDIHDAHTLAAERVELLTAARAARANAEQATRLKDEFLATVSHELRAPVTTMLLWEKVLREHHDPATREQALDAIRQSALAQARLVGDLLDVARAASGKLYVDTRPVGIGALIRDALEAVLPVALAKGVTLAHEAVPTAVVEGDVARLRQVLDNLLANAIKFTEPGGCVTLSARREGATLEIEIADTGRGIAAEFLERIFEPFQQTEDALTRREGGLGLGLAISRRLVALHGGTLVASSPGLGRGATMTIRLPLSRKRLSTDAPQPGASQTATLQHKQVLVVDDDARVREALVILLERAGARVVAVESAAGARARLEHDDFDVILCDISMPNEDGYAFVRSLRASGNQIPVIALTAHAFAADAKRASEAGFDLHLPKPVSFERLVRSVAALAEDHDATTP